MVTHQQLKKTELARRQADGLFSASNPPRGRVEFQVGDAQADRARNGAATAHSPQTGQKNIERERFGEVVVGARVQSADHAGCRVPCSQHQHRGLIVILAQFPYHMTETAPRWVEPIRYQHHEYEVVSLGPPQAQGIFIAIVLGVLKHLGIREMKPGSADHFWAMGQALRQGARHWEFVQDDTIYGVPRDELLDDGYHRHLAKLIRISRPKVDLTEHMRLAGDAAGGADLMSAFLGAAGKPRLANSNSKQPSGSCELAVVDAEGNWVQMMDTLQGSGIPGMVIGGVPMVGSHATFGGLQSPMDATLVKGAKGRCIIGNTMVLKNGRPVLSAGSPGNVHCTVPQVLTYALDFKMDPYAAVDAPRMLPMNEAPVLWWKIGWA